MFLTWIHLSLISSASSCSACTLPDQTSFCSWYFLFIPGISQAHVSLEFFRYSKEFPCGLFETRLCQRCLWCCSWGSAMLSPEESCLLPPNPCLLFIPCLFATVQHQKFSLGQSPPFSDDLFLQYTCVCHLQLALFVPRCVTGFFSSI